MTQVSGNTEYRILNTEYHILLCLPHYHNYSHMLTFVMMLTVIDCINQRVLKTVGNHVSGRILGFSFRPDFWYFPALSV
ncbi:hypothetical protein A2Z33_05940 [Candidatus Gottesmanbacteria bacterium RBG_16_52_11]|uniref:Uncharacterized protein n=1 Tax=Candidatus Gottesmanbacteria bacterium RBG_16_52_11 TaxID=1798374 RepID=A0A1F5YXK7_9BACT|nr:MAG: hypothetical protein A2Z33_05940 [Candidatus Gottesmanbacteria bacterium RBG_16_52_11]